MEEPKNRQLFLIGTVFLAVLSILLIAWLSMPWPGNPLKSTAPSTSSSSTALDGEATSTAENITLTSATVVKAVEHVSLPEEVRGFYWTADTAGSKRADELLAYAVASQLNTMVIDLKLDNGQLAFTPVDPELQAYAQAKPAIKDLDGLLERLKDQHMYRVARIFVMRDGAFGKLHPKTVLRNADGSVWRDKTGTTWLDPAAPEVAEYAVALGREAYARGFDEVQFDYVRFPTDGRISTIRYPIYDGKITRMAVFKKFFEQVGGTLQKEGVPVSFDLYGMTFWHANNTDIGQTLTDAYEFSDAVSPMVYPSHYPTGFQGFANPAVHPYEIVKQSLDKGIETLKLVSSTMDLTNARKKFRPWLQDFDIGATYDAPKITAQIKATRDAGAAGWMLWNARNVYTPMVYLK